VKAVIKIMPVLYEGEIQIPFDPTDRDVVSTKLRHWTLTHPGTLEYGRLLNEFVEHKLPNNPSTISELKEAAQEIIDIIQLDRGGRFLRISADAGHEPKVCILMTPKGIMSKVQSALKGKQTALLKKQGIFVPQGPKTLGFTTPLETPSCRNEGEKRKAATEEPTATTPTTSINTTTATPKSKRKKLGHSNSGNTTPRYPKHVTKLYKAIIPTDTSSTTTPITTSSTDKNKETNKETMVVPNSNIHPYALELIGHVCNFRNIACLDKPLPTKYQYPEDEPEKERLIRMQVCFFLSFFFFFIKFTFIFVRLYMDFHMILMTLPSITILLPIPPPPSSSSSHLHLSHSLSLFVVATPILLCRGHSNDDYDLCTKVGRGRLGRKTCCGRQYETQGG